MKFRSSLLALALVGGLSAPASARGFDWFFKHIPRSNDCPFGMREIPASFYWSGRRTATGEHFDANGNTAASRSYAFGTHLRLFNPRTKRELTVRVNDRGPYGIAHRLGVKLDLAFGAARRLGMKATEWICLGE